MADPRYVQFGCGLAAPADWLNFDSSPRLWLERVPGVGAAAGALGKRLFPGNVVFGDIVAGLPVADGSADGVYSSHVLEHLGREDIAKALTNTFRMLKPGGVFRVIVPDLHWRAARYVRDHGTLAAADAFVSSTHFAGTKRVRGPVQMLRSAFGNSGHAWLYDEVLLTRLLTEAGFTGIRRCTFNDSGDPMFTQVEDRGRFFDSGEAELALEARRPQSAA